MEFAWYFDFPDFENSDAWAEIKVVDFYFDPKRKAVLDDLAYGCADERLVIGMAIVKKSLQDPRLRLIEYRTLQGKGPLAVKWWDERSPFHYGTALLIGGAWRIRKEDEVFKWEIVYDPDDERLIQATPYFEKTDLPSSN